MADFKLPDPKKGVGKILGIGLLGGFGLLFYIKILPFLLTVVWGTVNLVIGMALLGLLLWIVTSKKFWSRIKIILEAFGETAFGWVVEMNPFAILNLSLDKAEEERKELLKQNELLRGQESKLGTQLQEQQQAMREAAAQLEIVDKALVRNPNDENEIERKETVANDFKNAKDFVDTVYPIHADVKKLVEITERAYRKSGNSLKNARNTVAMQKAKYEAVTAGRNAMMKAWKAFTGDPEMNKATGIALAKLQEDIANKVGTIRTTLKETSKIMNENDLKDAAKVNLAAKTIEQLNIDDTFDYVPAPEKIAVASAVPDSGKNKYLDFLK